jgi:hypothetical protein
MIERTCDSQDDAPEKILSSMIVFSGIELP